MQLDLPEDEAGRGHHYHEEGPERDELRRGETGENIAGRG